MEIIEQTLPFFKIMQPVFILGFATLFVSSLYSYIIKKLGAGKWFCECKWSFAFLQAANTPLKLLIALTGSLLAAESLASQFDLTQLVSLFTAVRSVSWIFILTYVLLQWKNRIEVIWKEEKEISGKSSMEKATWDAVGRLVSFAVLLLSGLTSLQVLGMPIQSFLAFGAVGAAGLAWASTDIVKNFFGGFMIHVMRPFAVGDWINSPEKEIEGVVEQIGWYQTQIRTFDRRPIYVPNGLFPAIVLRNPSRMSNRRILADIGIRYADIKSMNVIVQDIEKMLRAHPAIDTTKILMVHFLSFGAFSLNINVYCFTKTTDWAKWRTEQQDVFIKIAEIVESHGAEIAFPTQTLQIEKGSTSFEFEAEPSFT